jgi:hypothetical protein
VQKYGHNIKYVKQQSFKICMAAIQQNGNCIYDIVNPCEKMIISAILKASHMPDNPTPKMLKLQQKVYLKNFKESPRWIEYIDEPTKEICIEAYKHDPSLIVYCDYKIDYKIDYTVIPTPDDECAICSNIDGEWCKLAACNHIYHTDCFKKWVDTGININSCPMCRKNTFLYTTVKIV